MKPSIVVLTDFSPAAERALAYAAVLAGPLAAEVHVVNVYSPPAMTSRVAAVLYATNARYLRERRRTLKKVVADLPGPTTTELVEADWDTAVTEALARHQPMLLVAGLTATDGTIDEWLSNRPLPLARQTGYPLLLVPQHLPNAALRPPRCLALAVTDEAFALVPNALRVAPLLDALNPSIVTVCVVPANKWATGEHGLRAARRCGLAAAMPGSQLHTVVGEAPAPGILQAVAQLDADMLALVDRGHGWLHDLAVDSVFDQILRDTPVPVLLLAAQELPPED